MQTSNISPTYTKGRTSAEGNSLFFVLMGFLFVSRLVAMLFIPLNESTEARYGEIARKMLETNNWVTLWHDYNVPFWAKPPLSTWLSALSMKVFGINEFAVRLPSLLFTILVLLLVWNFAKKIQDTRFSQLAVLTLASSLFFFMDAGAVMTDPALLFCITYAFIAFWNAMQGAGLIWGYQLFFALGLGMLAKGPIALVLTGMPLFMWCCLIRSWKSAWQKLPWLSGLILFVFIAAPWYVLAEKATPGFLRYFLIGEHIQRYLDPGWDGDRYGFAHSEPLGMIWLYLFLGFLPWSLFFISGFLQKRKEIKLSSRSNQDFVLYLGLWAFIPLVFFTFSRNIILTYVFPSLPPLALLASYYWSQVPITDQKKPWLTGLSLISGILALGVTSIFIQFPEAVGKSQKGVIAEWNKHKSGKDDTLIFWLKGHHFSAEFYAHGHLVYSQDSSKLVELLKENPRQLLLIRRNQMADMRPDFFDQFDLVSTKKVENEEELLFRLKSS